MKTDHKMVSQNKKTSSSTLNTLRTRSLSSRNKKVVLFLILFIAYELRHTAEAKPAANMNTSQNTTIINKAGRYLTIGKSGITGDYLYSPYAKLQIRSVGFKGEIRIKAILMQKYLAMNSTGNVTLVSNKTRETVFIDQRKTGIPFALIRSKTFPSKYLTIGGTGFVSGTMQTNADYTKFVFFPVT